MKKQSFTEFIKAKKIAAGCAALALAMVIGSVFMVQESSKVPELPSYTDPVLEVSIEDEETPLASAPKVTTKTSKKTTKKNVTMKTAATKTYSKKLPTTKKTTTKTQKKANQTIRTETTVLTAATEKYTKKSKVKVVSTTVTTTVKTTTTTTSSGADSVFSSSPSGSSTKPVTSKNGKYEASVSKLAPLMDGRVISAYEKMGFKLSIDSSVSYAGYFDARTRMITLQMEDNTIYHELGHFLAFISGNTDKTSGFTAIYNQEKSKYTGVNKAYVTQNSSEYFAESVKDYYLNPGTLKSARPKTYAALTEALGKVTDAQINKILTVYAPVWK
ncbi:hypothetical protein NXH76_14395 [Blautia schinkii]|nr:hypothetical protein [Blautia schinkii]